MLQVGWDSSYEEPDYIGRKEKFSFIRIADLIEGFTVETDSEDYYDAAVQVVYAKPPRYGRTSCTVDFPYTVEGDPEITVTVESTVYYTRDSDERGEFEETDAVITEIKLCNGTVVDEDDLSLLANLPADYIETEMQDTAIHYYEHPEELDGYRTE